ncbi:MAG: patatin-like phospholipase family protein [Alphaproteobacteria bacterium]|nr:patatin-like phospholipase family protein [Alphaproteobacteria bacterium]
MGDDDGTKGCFWIMTSPKIGLALGGGIARGWAHIGVLQRLKELGVVPDLIAGTSMGALIGGIFLTGELDRFEGLVSALNRFRVVRLLDFMVSNNGVIGGKRLFRELDKIVGDVKIEQLDMPFTAVATELNTGHELWISEGCLLDAIRASVSLPGIFKPVSLNGRWMIDGALVNPVPVSVCRAMGARMVIAVNLTADTMGGVPVIDRRNSDAGCDGAPYNGVERRKNGRDKLGSAMRHFLAAEQEEPSFFGTMASSFNILLDRITRSRLAGDPPDVSIAPRLGHLSLLDFHRADEAIEEGRHAVDRVVPELRGVLGAFGGQTEQPERPQLAQAD